MGLSQGRRGAQSLSDLKPLQLVPAPLKVPIFGRRKFQNEPVGMLRQASTLKNETGSKTGPSPPATRMFQPPSSDGNS
ncbi:MAG: hypothetical protein OXC02_04955 [Rhodobacteraceae bacterium]|nr:hypothetical protein [Paracoccaceae bacterium]